MTTAERKKTIIMLPALCALLLLFWSDRYPALLQRAGSIGKTALLDRISPDAGIAANDPAKPLWERTAITAANWGWTNRKGMAFGVAFAAGVLTLLSYVRLRQSNNRYVNALCGLVAGTPLGVCSNCVSPVVKGMHEGGARKETALAMAVASPGLNIIVLSMLFAVFPLEIALIKLGATLALILLIVPMIAGSEQKGTHSVPAPDGPAACASAPACRPHGLGAVLRDYFKNLWHIFSRTVPLMLLAGLLGALAANLVDFTALAGEANAASLAALAVIGTFLPVPMAFDVMFAQSLVAAGGPLSAATVILVTFGSYSVLSCMVVRQTMGWGIALKMYGAVAGTGLLSGLLVAAMG
jgi:uncharacterized membrane protein YraQ (UPF0718 family)